MKKKFRNNAWDIYKDFTKELMKDPTTINALKLIVKLDLKFLENNKIMMTITDHHLFLTSFLTNLTLQALVIELESERGILSTINPDNMAFFNRTIEELAKQTSQK